MLHKVIQHKPTPITPEHTMTVNPVCRVIKLGDHASSDSVGVPLLSELLVAVQSETESILHLLEQHHEIKPGQ